MQGAETIINIRKAGYEKGKPAIEGVCFSVPQGQMVGLIGPNGAGKSTTINTIIGTMKWSDADIELPHSSMPAFVPEHPIYYDYLTLWEHCEWAAASYDMSRNVFLERIEPLLADFSLSHVKHDYPGQFSKGMQQKMMFVLAFLRKAELYIVDEPFIGLDPMATVTLLDYFVREKERGAAILMSTHVLDTAEKHCDSFVLIADGKLAAKGDLQQIGDICGRPGESLFHCFHTLLQDRQQTQAVDQ